MEETQTGASSSSRVQSVTFSTVSTSCLVSYKEGITLMSFYTVPVRVILTYVVPDTTITITI